MVRVCGTNGRKRQVGLRGLDWTHYQNLALCQVLGANAECNALLNATLGELRLSPQT
jgi:hypothetical protein